LVGELDRRGLRRKAAKIVGHAPGHVSLSTGEPLTCDHLVLATGLRGPTVNQTLGLPLDAVGRIKVAPILSSIADDHLFAVGDCATIEGWSRPFAGVFGVRAATTLIENLCGLGTGAPARAYRPQRRWLSIMDLGDATGLAMHGGLWWQGRTALALKRRLDLRFVERSRG